MLMVIMEIMATMTILMVADSGGDDDREDDYVESCDNIRVCGHSGDGDCDGECDGDGDSDSGNGFCISIGDSGDGIVIDDSGYGDGNVGDHDHNDKNGVNFVRVIWRHNVFCRS